MSQEKKNVFLLLHTPAKVKWGAWTSTITGLQQRFLILTLGRLGEGQGCPGARQEKVPAPMLSRETM